MEARKVLVKKGDVAIVTCPFCRKTKKLSVVKYKEKRKRELRVKCCCENIFCLCLEYRRHPRKPARLLGKSINFSYNRENQDIIIKDISLGGIGYLTFKKHRTQINDRLHVLFELNDCNNTHIDTEATVRAASKDHIGCEFNATENFKTSLGFYLLS